MVADDQHGRVEGEIIISPWRKGRSIKVVEAE